MDSETESRESSEGLVSHRKKMALEARSSAQRVRMRSRMYYLMRKQDNEDGEIAGVSDCSGILNANCAFET